jgi:hypothetical protein
MNRAARRHASMAVVVTWATESIVVPDVVRLFGVLNDGCLLTLYCVAQQCYLVTTLVNVDRDCGASSRFNNLGSSPPGFEWSDTLSGETVVERVTITFQTGHNCAGDTRTGTLNDGAELTYPSTLHRDCTAVTDNPTTLIFPGSEYNLAGDNTFLSTNPTSCLGFAHLQSGNPDAIGNWAEVCVYVGTLCAHDCLQFLLITVNSQPR